MDASPENEYQLILQLGFTQDVVNQSNYDQDISAEEAEGYSRPIVDQLISRPFRDIAFAKNIRTIYNDSCAMTGLKLINGGGHCEVEAAHIQPVGSGHYGPDSVRNGIALSRSIHWMFDRGFLSLTDEYEILMVKKLVPDPVKRLFNPDGQAWVSTDAKLRPHPRYLRYHREHIFKG